MSAPGPASVVPDRRGSHSSDASSIKETKRRRTAYACDSCRSRKTRCDSGNPCSTCEYLQVQCNYGRISTSSKGKNDLILDTVLRIDRVLSSLQGELANPVLRAHLPESPQSLQNQLDIRSPHSDSGETLMPATIPASHTSATEEVLSWAIFSPFPTLRASEYQPVFQLEHTRPPLAIRQNVVYPFVAEFESQVLADAFQRNVNFWYPTMSLWTVGRLWQKIRHNDYDCSLESCAALLVMALGSACELIESIKSQQEGANAYPKNAGLLYLDAAMKLLPVATIENSALAVQCLFYMGLYFCFLQRPLQAWTYINLAATKCRLLLAYSSSGLTTDDQESIRRVFWSCYIIESDLIAELSELPQSGVSAIESQVPLPGPLATHDPETSEQSSLYFLACISIRRLLNRVHNLLHSQGPGELSKESLRNVVSELDNQLETWRDMLPEDLKFSIDNAPQQKERQGFLRQRFLACKTIIFRPYLDKVLRQPQLLHGEETMEGVEKCISACCSAIINIAGFGHTVVIDTWICALSMGGAMLVILAACQSQQVRKLVSHDVRGLGRHLQSLLSTWMNIVPDRSPSVCQALNIIAAVDKILLEEVLLPEAIEEERSDME